MEIHSSCLLPAYGNQPCGIATVHSKLDKLCHFQIRQIDRLKKVDNRYFKFIQPAEFSTLARKIDLVSNAIIEVIKAYQVVLRVTKVSRVQ